MTSKAEFFQGLSLRTRPENQLMSAIRLRTCNPNSLLARPALLPSSFWIDNCSTSNDAVEAPISGASPSTPSFGSQSTRASATRSPHPSHLHSSNHHSHVSNTQTDSSSRENHGSNANAAHISQTYDSAVDSDDPSLKSQQLKHIRERITSRQLQNIVHIKRIFNASSPYGPSVTDSSGHTLADHYPAITNDQHTTHLRSQHNHHHHHHHHHNTPDLGSLVPLSPVAGKHYGPVGQAKNEARMRDKRVKFLKHLSKLEFSSALFRKTYLRVSYLTNKPNYEQILSYDRWCATSNKALIKQSLIKTQMFKCKTSRSRTRMLRSTEVINGKETEQWQRPINYTHTFCFNKRQRLRRYYQIQRAFGFQRRVLRLSYGRLQIVLPKLEECPSCKEKLNADYGHCCARRKSHANHRSSKNSSLLANGGPTPALVRRPGRPPRRPLTSSFIEAHQPTDSTFDQPNFTESTTLMIINQDKTEYYDYGSFQSDSGSNEAVFGAGHSNGDDVSIIKVSESNSLGDSHLLSSSTPELRLRRKCGSTLLLDSSNFKDTSSLLVKRIPFESELDQIKCNSKSDDFKAETIQLRRIKSNQYTNRVQSKVITIAHENRLPVEKSIQIA